MRNLINSYTEFLNESKMELLLEANIKYLPEFIDILNEIDSPISDKLMSLYNKDVDVNTNYVNIDSEKEDFITFIPDDKIEKKPYTVRDSGGIYDNLSLKALKDKTYDIGHIAFPDNGDNGIIVKELTIDELCKISPKGESIFRNILNSGGSLVHFRFHINSRSDYYKDNNIFYGNIIISKKSLERNLNDIKRIDFRIGKFVSKILTSAGIKFTLIELEDFVDKYKSRIKLKKELWVDRFKIVKGEEIRYWYNSENYLIPNDGSSLGSSCMRYARCQPYLDIYTNNTNVVQLVILMAPPVEMVDEETGEVENVSNDKICGRAILWTDIHGRKIMDRIYVNESSDVKVFKEYANINNFYCKSVQDYNSDTYLEFHGSLIEKREENTIVVQLKRNVDYSYYPYMDTLKYYNIKTGIITNDESERYDYELESTEGNTNQCRFCGGEGRVYCNECEGNGEITCSDCEGSGLNGEENCENCDGSGDVSCEVCDGSGDYDCPEC